MKPHMQIYKCNWTDIRWKTSTVWTRPKNLIFTAYYVVQYKQTIKYGFRKSYGDILAVSFAPELAKQEDCKHPAIKILTLKDANTDASALTTTTSHPPHFALVQNMSKMTKLHNQLNCSRWTFGDRKLWAKHRRGLPEE